MKISTAIFLAIMLSAFEKMPFALCDLIDQLKPLKKLNYSTEIKDGFISSEAIEINREILDALFNADETYKQGYLVGKMKITNDRTGLISSIETYEGENLIQSFYLHVVDGCKIRKSYKIMTSDDAVIIYEISSKISQDHKNIVIKTQTSNALNTDSNTTDTLFINQVKIDLTSKNLDTISKINSFQFLTSPSR